MKYALRLEKRRTIRWRKQILRVLFTMILSGLVIGIADRGVSAQTFVDGETPYSSGLDRGEPFVRARIADARLLSAASAAEILTATGPTDRTRRRATSPRSAVASSNAAAKSRRSKLRTTLIGAAIGGAVGVAGGVDVVSRNAPSVVGSETDPLTSTAVASLGASR
jgi:hypothetical protein